MCGAEAKSGIRRIRYKVKSIVFADVTTVEQRPLRMLVIDICGGFGSIIAEVVLGKTLAYRCEIAVRKLFLDSTLAFVRVQSSARLALTVSSV